MPASAPDAGYDGIMPGYLGRVPPCRFGFSPCRPGEWNGMLFIAAAPPETFTPIGCV